MEFAKMHGTGNDFVVVDARGRDLDGGQLAVTLCDRHYGIGADGVLLVGTSRTADFRMRTFNPDGSEAEMCGNGIRCFAKYVIEEGLAPKGRTELKVETMAGVHALAARMVDGTVRSVRVGMGRPRFKPDEIPVKAAGVDRVIDHPLIVGAATIPVTCLSMGNPHAVTFLKEPVGRWPLKRTGPRVERHPFFPERVNFEIVNVLSRSHLVARVWERGAGPTMACGTGACAAAVAARLHDYTEEQVTVSLPGGDLEVQWDRAGEVWLEGPAELVFKGVWLGEKV